MYVGVYVFVQSGWRDLEPDDTGERLVGRRTWQRHRPRVLRQSHQKRRLQADALSSAASGRLRDSRWLVTSALHMSKPLCYNVYCALHVYSYSWQRRCIFLMSLFVSRQSRGVLRSLVHSQRSRSLSLLRRRRPDVVPRAGRLPVSSLYTSPIAHSTDTIFALFFNQRYRCMPIYIGS